MLSASVVKHLLSLGLGLGRLAPPPQVLRRSRWRSSRPRLRRRRPRRLCPRALLPMLQVPLRHRWTRGSGRGLEPVMQPPATRLPALLRAHRLLMVRLPVVPIWTSQKRILCRL